MDKDAYLRLTREYGDIFSIELGDTEFFYRALTLDEINIISSILEDDSTSVDMEDLYVQNGVVYPSNLNLDKIKPGFVTTIAQSIMRVSGSSADYILDTLFLLREQRDQDILFKIKAIILSAMPTHTDEYLDSLTVKQLLEKLVLSEEILTKLQEVHLGAVGAGVRLELAVKDEQKPSKKQAKEKIDKETLLRRIKKEDRVGAGAQTAFQANEQIKDLDEEILVKAAGVLKDDDPIARKLREAMLRQ